MLWVKYIFVSIVSPIFRYVKERKILDGVSFVVPAGKSIAIVGSSGSGK